MWDWIRHCIWGTYLIERDLVGELLGVSFGGAAWELRACLEAKKALGEMGAQNRG